MDTSRSSRSGREGVSASVSWRAGATSGTPKSGKLGLRNLFQPQLKRHHAMRPLEPTTSATTSKPNIEEALQEAYVGEYADFADYVRQTR